LILFNLTLTVRKSQEEWDGCSFFRQFQAVRAGYVAKLYDFDTAVDEAGEKCRKGKLRTCPFAL
jgi:hypothetical protein